MDWKDILIKILKAIWFIVKWLLIISAYVAAFVICMLLTVISFGIIPIIYIILTHKYSDDPLPPIVDP